MDAHRLRPLIAAAALVLLVACAPGPTGPAAMSGYQIVTGNTSTLSAPLGVATGIIVTCPGTKVVVGGGYTTMDEAANVFESGPTANGNGWSVSARNENVIGSTISVVPIAICVDRPSGYLVVTGPGRNLSTQQVAGVEARCPDATFRLTGGGVRSGDAQSHPFVSIAGTSAQPSWLGTAKNNFPTGLPSSTSLNAFAICAALLQVPGATTVVSPTVTVGANSRTTISATCPTGTRVLSGGISSAQSPAGWFDSGPMPGGGGWTASVVSPLLAGTAVNASVSANCALAN